MGGEITQLLERAADGEKAALDAVFSALYSELQQMASARIHGHKQSTLSPTVLVHELYEKLSKSSSFSAQNRSHFFACAARAMRHIIVDHARARSADKRGGNVYTVTFNESQIGADTVDVLSLDEALETLGEVDIALLEIVELRFFTGLSVAQIAEHQNISERSMYRRWRTARAMLQAILDEPSATEQVSET